MTWVPGNLQSSWQLSEMERLVRSTWNDLHWCSSFAVTSPWTLFFFPPNWNWIVLWCCSAPFLSKSPGGCLEGGVCVLAILPVPSPAHITPFWEQFPFTSSALLIPWVSKLNQLTDKQGAGLPPPPPFRINQHLDIHSWITQPSDFVWDLFFFILFSWIQEGFQDSICILFSELTYIHWTENCL